MSNTSGSTSDMIPASESSDRLSRAKVVESNKTASSSNPVVRRKPGRRSTYTQQQEMRSRSREAAKRKKVSFNDSQRSGESSDVDSPRDQGIGEQLESNNHREITEPFSFEDTSSTDPGNEENNHFEFSDDGSVNDEAVTYQVEEPDVYEQEPFIEKELLTFSIRDLVQCYRIKGQIIRPINEKSCIEIRKKSTVDFFDVSKGSTPQCFLESSSKRMVFLEGNHRLSVLKKRFLDERISEEELDMEVSIDVWPLRYAFERVWRLATALTDPFNKAPELSTLDINVLFVIAECNNDGLLRHKGAACLKDQINTIFPGLIKLEDKMKCTVDKDFRDILYKSDKRFCEPFTKYEGVEQESFNVFLMPALTQEKTLEYYTKKGKLPGKQGFHYSILKAALKNDVATSQLMEDLRENKFSPSQALINLRNITKGSVGDPNDPSRVYKVPGVEFLSDLSKLKLGMCVVTSKKIPWKDVKDKKLSVMWLSSTTEDDRELVEQNLDRPITARGTAICQHQTSRLSYVMFGPEVELRDSGVEPGELNQAWYQHMNRKTCKDAIKLYAVKDYL